MNSELSAHEAESNSVDDGFDDEVEGIVDVLPNTLENAWLSSLGDDPGLEENEMLLRVAFWDAARVVIEAMLRAGYTLTPPAAAKKD